MEGGGYGAPNSGEVLLKLLRNPPTSKSSTSLQEQRFQDDPAIALVGPAIRTAPLQDAAITSNCQGLQYPSSNQGSTTPLFVPDHYFQNPNLNPDVSLRNDRFFQLGGVSRNLGSPDLSREVEQNIVFGSFNRNVSESDAAVAGIPNFRRENIGDASVDRRFSWIPKNSVENNGKQANSSFLRSNEQSSVATTVNQRKQSFNGSDRAVFQPPAGFSNNATKVGNLNPDNRTRNRVQKIDGRRGDTSSNHRGESPGPPAGLRYEFSPSISIVESTKDSAEIGEESKNGTKQYSELEDQFAKALEIEDKSGDKVEKKKHQRDRDYRSDKRGQWIMNQRMRNIKSNIRCRSDINRFNALFIEIYESLIPAEEEKAKQMQLLGELEKLVIKEWPAARLHLYGSCANSFGFPKSDIDVCLVMNLENTDKIEVVLKLAEILESENLQNVQAFTRARVPIVKLNDPVTGISCDICVNNVLAVVNTKLLRDYVQIDDRLRQLAFIVKHWAKSRQVNETYHGTLSSYAYVLMCIGFLQQRVPPILPCLQEMESTYSTSVENVECAYFDQVDKLKNFGSGNREPIAHLVWAFFNYWAHCHDYAKDVISVRKGSTLSKQDKDWTRRVGNDQHLICIEDPFEISHDLGRVVDKHSVRVLREEFERAARIMQHDPNPCFSLFEPYVSN